MPRLEGFCGPSYLSRAPQALLARSMNWYPQPIEIQNAKRLQYVLNATPGLATYASSTDAPGRGIFAQSGRAWAAIGQNLQEVTALTATTGALTPRGAMALDPSPVTFTTNGEGGNQLFIGSGDEGYILDLTTNVLTPVVAGVTQVGMLDTFFIRFDRTNSLFAISGALDGLTWDPLQFAQRSTASDPWKAMLVRPPGIWLLGEQTGDIYYNNKGFPFPFVPLQGVRLREGIAATFSLADSSTGPIWLSRSAQGIGTIVQAQGYRAVAVSPEGVNFTISGYAKIDDAVAFSYKQQGREFYEVNFPSAGATWVWDIALGAAGWHERGHWDSDAYAYGAWGPQYHAFEFGHNLVADFRSGTIHRMSIGLYTDALGAPLRRMRIAPLVFDQNRLVKYPRIEIYGKVGVGLTSGQGSDPQLGMRMSRDAGQTWGHERMRSLGRLGRTRTRVVFTRCGGARDGAIQVVCAEPVDICLVDAFIKAA